MFEHKFLEVCDKVIEFLHNQHIPRVIVLRVMLMGFLGISFHLTTIGEYDIWLFAFFLPMFLLMQYIEEQNMKRNLDKVNANKVVVRTTLLQTVCRLMMVSIHVLALPGEAPIEIAQSVTFLLYVYFQATLVPTDPPMKRFNKVAYNNV